jgi:hypothetical protein
MFSIDFNKLITWALPFLRRQSVYFMWMQALCYGVVSLYNELLVNQAANLYNLAHDSRVFSMQAVLNDQFDDADRRIYISDGLNKQRIYLYTREEAQPVYLNPVIYIYSDTDYADTGVDFIVWVPTAVVVTAQNMVLLNSLVTQYKLASKRYVVYRVAL